MRKFLIQTIDGNIVHDFCFHLIKSIEFNNWFRGSTDYSYIKSESVKGFPDCIPVGSLEFIFEYIEEHFDIGREFIKPLNIPEELNKIEYLGRECYISRKEDLLLSEEELFVKSNTQYKKYHDILKDKSNLEDDEYFVSEVIKLESEWRAFIQHGKLVGLKNYIGDFTLLPNIELLENMIKDYKDCPSSYTLDVGITKNQTVIIEVHPFVSCGLYGFSDYGKITSMMIQGFNYIKKEAEYQKSML